MRVFHEAPDAEVVRRVNADAPATFGKFQRFQDLQVAALFSQSANSGLAQHFDEWLRGAVQDGQFQGVQFDVHVVHAAGIKCGEQVLGCGKQHTLLHQARSVTDARHVSHVRFDLKIVQVYAPKHDPSIGGSWHEPKVGFYCRVEGDALGRHGPFNGGLIAHVSNNSSILLAFRHIVYTNRINKLKTIQLWGVVKTPQNLSYAWLIGTVSLQNWLIPSPN